MVLAQLGGSISRALAQMSNATVIDEKVLGECLNEISRALLQSDVRKIVNLETLAAGTNKRRIIQQVVFTELCNMLDPGKPVFTPKKGKPNVVMFVGLQGQSDSPTNLACLLCLLFYTYY
ncbi:signal recognition particle subunit SRP54 2 [Aegilops tauschii subsp. strangulata]|uniref:Signal recognition particle 54 kDa protein 2 n=1 Tax=Aegilops tauschii TaxID=37682 RepID=M8B0P4_AEGTA|nr:signal recognition particle 54 kDa protein 2 [Aegilops tauschii subsp. strangulata]